MPSRLYSVRRRGLLGRRSHDPRRRFVTEVLEPRCLLDCQGLPFTEDFESFEVAAAPQWTFAPPEAFVVSNDHGPFDAHHLMLTLGNRTADAVLTINMPSPSEVVDLKFFSRNVSGEASNVLSVQVSDDRTNWHDVTRISSDLDDYLFHRFDLREVLDASNLTSETFFIRFRASGREGHQYALDNVEVTDGSTRLDTVISQNRLTEGESSMMTITRHVGLDSPVTLFLENESPEQIVVPPTVTIDGDEASTSFLVRAADDGNLDGTNFGTFAITGPGINLLRCRLTAIDNDTQEQRSISGPLQGKIHASEYVVNSTLEVWPDTTLEIDPGSTLRFDSDAGVTIQGSLLARGDADARIMLTSNSQARRPGEWNGVSIRAAGEPRTMMDYVDIQYATTGITVVAIESDPAITVSRSSIHHSSGHGIEISAHAPAGVPPKSTTIGAGQVSILDNDIYSNGINGVVISASNNGCGSSVNTANVVNNRIHSNVARGMFLSATGTGSTQCLTPGPRSSRVSGLVADNEIERNGLDGVYTSATRGENRNSGHLNVTFSNNLVALNGQDGFDFFESRAFSDHILYNNSVADNRDRGVSYDGQARMHNNIVVGNFLGIEARGVVEFGDQVSHNLVMGNREKNWDNFPPTYGVPHHDAESQFLFDFHRNLLESPRLIGGGDFHLRFDSPAIDVGLSSEAVPTHDSDGQVRSELVDIGYDEFVDRVRNEWAHDAFVRETRDDSVISLAAGADGSVYTAGTRRFVGEDQLVTGDATTFIQKLAVDGETTWQVDISGIGDVRAKEIGVDADGNVYVAGVFSGRVDFDERATHAKLRDELESRGEHDVFLLKLNQLGKFQWVVQFGSDSNEQVGALHVSPLGDVTVGGQFSNNVDFNPHASFAETRASNGSGDGFIVSLTTDADYLWSWSGGGARDDAVTALTADSSDTVHAAMSFEGSLDVDSDGSLDMTSDGETDVVLFRLNRVGFTRGPFLTVSGPGRHSVEALALDEQGNWYLGGHFEGQLDFGPNANEAFRRNSLDDSFDTFFSSHDPSGVVRWVEQVGGPGDDRAVDVDLRANGDLLLTGNFVDVISSAASERIPQDFRGTNRDVFLLSTSTDGTFQRLNTYGGTGDDRATSAVALPDGRVAFAGDFSETIEFRTETGVLRLESNGRKDAFVAQLTAEHDSIPGDYDGNRVANADDIDLFFAAAEARSYRPELDLTSDGRLNEDDANQMIVNQLRTMVGDANVDGVFDSSDLVLVFQAGQYEDEIAGNSGWGQGDWNGDGDFGTADLVLAFQTGSYTSQ